LKDVEPNYDNYGGFYNSTVREILSDKFPAAIITVTSIGNNHDIGKFEIRMNVERNQIFGTTTAAWSAEHPTWIFYYEGKSQTASCMNWKRIIKVMQEAYDAAL
jgi:hypothetical protein